MRSQRYEKEGHTKTSTATYISFAMFGELKSTATRFLFDSGNNSDGALKMDDVATSAKAV